METPTTPQLTLEEALKLELGIHFIFYNRNLKDFQFNGSEVEFISVNNYNLIKVKIIKSNNPNVYANNSIQDVSAEYLYYLIHPSPPKPHEYSPVFMTGRYKTVGD